MALFPLYYAGNIAYYKALVAAKEIEFEVKEHFVKQSYRTKFEILGPNGLHKLSIPTIKHKTRRVMDEVEICYEEKWQKDHWKGMEAAYRRSPYFEYYEDHFHPFYKSKTNLLIDFNLNFHAKILELLKLDLPHILSSEYKLSSEIELDFRLKKFELDEVTNYIQVFGDRNPFIQNLSILDALFNLGPRAADLLG